MTTLAISYYVITMIIGIRFFWLDIMKIWMFKKNWHQAKICPKKLSLLFGGLLFFVQFCFL